jgi:GAF domain-containing protein
VVPIELRGEKLGSLTLRREANQPAWSALEAELVRSALAQVALTLDNARLQEESRRRSLSEQTIGQISSRAQSALDLETVIKTAVQEIGQVLGGARVQIRIAESAPDAPANAVEGAGGKSKEPATRGRHTRGPEDSRGSSRPGSNGKR